MTRRLRRDARPCPGRHGRGWVLMGLLVLLAMMGATLAQHAPAWAHARQREAEQELLFIGNQYRQALESYYRASPAGARRLPTQLDELLRDSRFPQPVRHLRKAYADPIAPGTAWGLVMQGPQIVGVYSQAEGQPFKRAGFDPGQEAFADATRYADWRFVYVPRGRAPAPGGAASMPATGRPATP